MSAALAALRRMTARDPGEEHRAATPLELLFDLCFVLAVAGSAAFLHHCLAQGDRRGGGAGFLQVFFAMWWGWLNFAWFASAFDIDDVLYRSPRWHRSRARSSSRPGYSKLNAPARA